MGDRRGAGAAVLDPVLDLRPPHPGDRELPGDEEAVEEDEQEGAHELERDGPSGGKRHPPGTLPVATAQSVSDR